jgi:formylglycine-generating enzyme required for sulfatase activity
LACFIFSFCAVATTVFSADDAALDALLKRFHSEFVLLTPGEGRFPATYFRGASGEDGAKSVEEIRLTEPFAIAKYEMPQNLYEAVMGSNPSRWKGPRNSVEMMSWRDANECCRKLTKHLQDRKLIQPDEEIRLPTETEWEYACRAGTKTRYSFGDEIRRADDPPKKNSILDEYGWYTGNAAGNDPPVGALKPNAWGLYDMHGYLWELTREDKLTDSDKEPVVLRSGSWKDAANRLTSAARREFPRDGADDAVGFRCVLAKKP